VFTGHTDRRVLPDGCLDLVWLGDELVVAGQSSRAFLVGSTSREPRVGVRPRIGAGHAVLGHGANDLLDISPSAADVWRHGDLLAERVALASSPRDKLAVLTDEMAARVRAARPVDPDVRFAVTTLATPGARVADAGRHLSQRQLRRRFETAVGYSPKALAGVLRLQRFLRLARTVPRLADLAQAAGYADQSHLGRETLRLTGLTPAALLALGSGPAGEPGLEAGRASALRTPAGVGGAAPG
jgi:AraC-like DNA-binding protein